MSEKPYTPRGIRSDESNAVSCRAWYVKNRKAVLDKKRQQYNERRIQELADFLRDELGE